jgi:hypothetical protein
MDEADDERPAARRRSRQDPDEDDERPRRRSRDDDREDEEEDDGPRRPAKKKGKKSKSGGGNSTMLILLGVAGLVGVLLLGGGVWLLMTFLGGNSSNAQLFVPGNAQGFVTVRVLELSRTAAGKKMFDQVNQQAKGVGNPNIFKPEEIDRLTYVIVDGEKNIWWSIAESNKLMTTQTVRAEFPNARDASHEGKSYIAGSIPGMGNTPMAAYLVHSRMMILGSETGVKRAIELSSKPRVTGSLDSQLHLLSSSKHITGTFQLPPTLANELKNGLNNPMAKQFAAIGEFTSGSFSANVGDALDLELTATYPGDAQAQAAKAAADKALAAASVGIGAFKGNLKPDQQQIMSSVEKAIETIKITQSGASVQITIRFEGFANALNQLPNPGAGGFPGLAPNPGGGGFPGPRPGPGPGFGGGMPPGPPGPRPR